MAVVSAVALGLSAGAMLAEAAVLVTYWRSVPPADFLGWYALNADRLLTFYGPLEGAAALAAIVAAVLGSLQRSSRRGLLVTSAACAVAVLLTFPLYFERVNAGFADGSIALDAVSAELRRWATWHWARTVIGTIAFVAAVLALRGRDA